MPRTNETIAALRKELKDNSDEAVRESAYRFFKEEVKFYGVKSAVVDRIAHRYFREVGKLDKKAVFALCEELLRSDYGEEAGVAFEWAYGKRKEFVPADFAVFERWLEKYVNNWAKCDTLCNHTIGDFVERYPAFIPRLKAWTRSKNRWLRRAAAVTLILPARNGKFLKDAFEITDALLHDEDDLVQKGYGWLLKEASKAHQAEVFEYVLRHKGTMPRTALRYAIEKMPAELRRRAMEK